MQKPQWKQRPPSKLCILSRSSTNSRTHTAVVRRIAIDVAEVDTAVLTVHTRILCVEDATAGDTYSECVDEPEGTPTQTRHLKKHKAGVKQVEESEESETEADCLWLEELVEGIHKVYQPPIKVPVLVDGMNVCMELDTGTSVALLSEQTVVAREKPR